MFHWLQSETGATTQTRFFTINCREKKTIERNVFFTDAISDAITATTLFFYKHRLKYFNLGLFIGQIPRHPILFLVGTEGYMALQTKVFQRHTWNSTSFQCIMFYFMYNKCKTIPINSGSWLALHCYYQCIASNHFDAIWLHIWLRVEHWSCRSWYRFSHIVQWLSSKAVFFLIWLLNCLHDAVNELQSSKLFYLYPNGIVTIPGLGHPL